MNNKNCNNISFINLSPCAARLRHFAVYSKYYRLDVQITGF